MAIPGGYAGIQGTIASAIGGFGVPGAFNQSLQQNPASTTTAVNLVLVVNGQPQGLVKSLSIDEQFNMQRVKALGSAINIALLPGVYEATASVNKAFLYGQSIEGAFGGGLRPVVGKYLADPDFTKFYFNILEATASGITIATRHDCVLTSVRRTYEIDQVVIIEDASILIRWSDTPS
jgi:hypothetical protein